jgi:hypothetical protein
VPAYSNRDAVFDDIAAPGDRIFSTIPRRLVQSPATCVDGAYSDCGPKDFSDAIGTSFSAPQVTAAAALLLGQDPKLTPDQVSWLLERTARDDTAATGCSECPAGRDEYTGWGMLDVQAALTALTDGTPLPPPDRYEPNDDAGPWSHALPPLPRTVQASLDYWDDDVDVYRIHLPAQAKLFARVTAHTPGTVRMTLWAPGTKRVEGLSADVHDRVAVSRRAGGQVRLAYRSAVAGTYYLELKLAAGERYPTQYSLALARAR